VGLSEDDSHGATEAHPPHKTPAPVGSVLKDPYDVITHTEPRRHGGFSIAQHSTAQNSTKPKLRASVTPCETQLFIALWSLTSTTLCSHGATETRRLSHRTEQYLSSVPPCPLVKPCSCWFSAQRPARRYYSHGDAAPKGIITSRPHYGMCRYRARVAHTPFLVNDDTPKIRFIVDYRGSSAQRPTRRYYSHGDNCIENVFKNLRLHIGRVPRWRDHPQPSALTSTINNTPKLKRRVATTLEF